MYSPINATSFVCPTNVSCVTAVQPFTSYSHQIKCDSPKQQRIKVTVHCFVSLCKETAAMSPHSELAMLRNILLSWQEASVSKGACHQARIWSPEPTW